ncbi:MAG: ribosome maturation factor RimM [Tissierellia bacterium]|nr:ribosome maturation factor RimM [Tissierellia bacterium]
MEKTIIGKIVASHGLRGHVRIYPLTDEASRFKKLDSVYVGDETKRRQVESVSLHKNMVLTKLEGVDNRDQADSLRDVFVSIPKEERMPLAHNRYYISDLIGLAVYDTEGRDLGQVLDVSTGHANAVLTVKGQGGDSLVPMVKEFIQSVDLEKGQIVIKPIKGMIK